ncbi:MAG TPA: [FeFe] hydrogenase H-cluster maturation GTPase HydF [Bacteroidales bacterium]|nr:[FeFe] hydrogenase H-cluster maturation GTPase HydF [Bacteroidales bacterium]
MAKENKPHIGIYGRRNNGKSSWINKLAGQDVAIVSDIAGTTTDPVKKSMEIHGAGPVIMIDTAGIDDVGELGQKRIAKTLQSINHIDLAILVVTNNEFGEPEKKLINQFIEKEVPYFILVNKCDVDKPHESFIQMIKKETNAEVLTSSINNQADEDMVLSLIKKLLPENAWKKESLFGDLVSYGDVVLLIMPIDNEAPEGRLILPQVQAIRDALDNDCVAIVVKEREADAFLRNSGIKPKLAITDSSIFIKADAIVPKDVPLTGFSVLLARHKGPFDTYLNGTPYISKLQDGDKVLILESCTHQVSCDDIGRVKIPRWLSQFTGRKLQFEVASGLSTLSSDLKQYALVIQCGGCMITRRQIYSRLKPAIDEGVPVTNYGMAIAYIQGIYNRAIQPFVKGHIDLSYL